MNLPYIHEDWQIETLEALFRLFMSKAREGVLIRSRGASKSHDTMKWCLYMIYLGFEIIYFTANASQLERPKIYMKDLINRSFLKWCIHDRNDLQKERVVFDGGGMLTLVNLTENKAISPRADGIVFDEERKADPDAYNNTHGIFADTNLGFTLHISTPEKATIFEDTCEDLRLEGIRDNEQYIFERVLQDVSFLWDRRRGHYERLKRKLPQWLWDQEFECKFTLPHGAVFHNVKYIPYPDWLMNLIQDQHLCSGVDWNPVNGHWLVSGKWSPDMMNFVFLEAHDIGKGYALNMNMDQFQTIAQHGSLGNHITLEKGGVNAEYIIWYRKLQDKTGFNWTNQNIHTEEWDSQGVEKQKVVTHIIQNGITMWCDKTREDLFVLGKMIGDCRWDANADKPKLAKNPADSPHALDAGLHAMSKKNFNESQIEVGRFY